MSDERWFKTAIFYEVYIRAFKDANGDGHGDIRGLIEKLDYFVALGVDCLWLLPMYPSPLLDDGYDISDYRSVHQDYGTLEDLKALIQAAHARGLRVIADLVLNHTSFEHPWFQSARSDPNSLYRDYYVWSNTDQKYKETRIIFLDTESSNWTWDELADMYYWHRFYSSQPDLNFDNPAVREEMIDIMKFWLDIGLDGFRVDAIPYLFEREGTNCENLPETHEYLKRVRREMDEYAPGTILLAEANQWPQDLRPYFGDGDEMHMGFHFPLMPRIYMALRKMDREPVLKILEATPPIPENCQWCTFLRNHDELTLEMVTPEEREWMWNEYAPESRMRLNLGIRRRLSPLLDGDRRKIELANGILFGMPGAPIIYYGDEIGMGDNIWLEDRDGVRTPMQWNDQKSAGFSSADHEKLFAPVIDDERYSYKKVNVAAQMKDPDSLWHFMRKLVAVRKANRIFVEGDFQSLDLGNKHILAFVRSMEGQTLLAVYNLSQEEQTIILELPNWEGAQCRDLLDDVNQTGRMEARYAMRLPAFGFRWLKLDSE